MCCIPQPIQPHIMVPYCKSPDHAAHGTEELQLRVEFHSLNMVLLYFSWLKVSSLVMCRHWGAAAGELRGLCEGAGAAPRCFQKVLEVPQRRLRGKGLEERAAWCWAARARGKGWGTALRGEEDEEEVLQAWGRHCLAACGQTRDTVVLICVPFTLSKLILIGNKLIN